MCLCIKKFLNYIITFLKIIHLIEGSHGLFIETMLGILEMLDLVLFYFSDTE